MCLPRSHGEAKLDRHLEGDLQGFHAGWRAHARGRSAFPVLLGMFALTLALTQTVTRTTAWQGFAQWMASLSNVGVPLS